IRRDRAETLTLTARRAGNTPHYLTDDERAAGDSMMACVSRAAAGHLELDL
ncbi:hypothetical protein IU469_36975, partial [Nocardia puris]|nr:hypothetical protein [Nocardia puris]